jgi:hypothetical protein
MKYQHLAKSCSWWKNRIMVVFRAVTGGRHDDLAGHDKNNH